MSYRDAAKNRAYAKAQYEKHGPRINARKAALRRANPSRTLVNSAKGRAAKLGIEFNITPADVVVPSVCPVLGIKIAAKAYNGKSGATGDSPSLDRIDSSKGYVKGNVRVISNRANALKSNATVAELALVFRDAKILAGLESADE